jgi:hypothetical protein
LETFMGVPRSALIHFLKNNQNAIDVDFILTGDTSNPNFSINEAITTRVALGMAAELGVSIGVWLKISEPSADGAWKAPPG